MYVNENVKTHTKRRQRINYEGSINPHGDCY